MIERFVALDVIIVSSYAKLLLLFSYYFLFIILTFLYFSDIFKLSKETAEPRGWLGFHIDESNEREVQSTKHISAFVLY